MESVKKSLQQIDATLYPWCTALRAVHNPDSELHKLVTLWRNMAPWQLKQIDVERLATVTQGEMIDRFLRLDDYRIVADESGSEEDMSLESQLDDDDDFVSEELAQIYASQGLNGQAVEIYRKLILLNPKKSAYFATQREKLSNL